MAHHDLILQPLPGVAALDLEELLARRDADWRAALEAERCARRHDAARHAAELASACAEAEARGREQGAREAAEALEQPLAQALAALDGAARQACDLTRAHIEVLEPHAVRLAVALAEKVIAGEVRSQPEIAARVFREAMTQLHGREVVRARFNPADLEPLKAQAPGPPLELVADPQVPRGGCVVEADAGEFDATLETRLQEAVVALWERHDAPGS